ncbi:50S ribosomal protein L3 [Candidatus Azambacteria bacterium]|nr:50S ribosomal protein L3 [Candidatus Azambacteria bacterium]MBI2587755.1 50S ribosomal protein L3 [Candidatus Azambacteria bacterium]
MTIRGKKIEMTQVFDAEGTVIPVTVIELASPEVTGLKPGGILKITGTSKGKGFQGVVKRHGFHGGPKSHGQKDRLRAPGSIGSSFPERVRKGKRMAGRMGGKSVSVRNLSVVDVDEKHRLLLVKGAVPGSRGSVLKITPIP